MTSAPWWTSCFPLNSQHNQFVRWDAGEWRGGGNDRVRAEKALHRLVLLRVVRDYTVDYPARGFEVTVEGVDFEGVVGAFAKFVAAYQQRLVATWGPKLRALQGHDLSEFVKAASDLLVKFIYEHIEQARRRALATMLEAAAAARTNEDLRRRILEYLEQTEWDEQLEEVRASVLGGLDVFTPLLDDVVSPNDAAALRGAADRMLSSYPDVPAVLFIRGFAELLCRDGNGDVALENVRAGIQFALGPYALPPQDVGAAVGVLAAATEARRKIEAARTLVRAVVTSSKAGRVLIRGFLEGLPATLAEEPACWLLHHLLSEIRDLNSKREGVNA